MESQENIRPQGRMESDVEEVQLQCFVCDTKVTGRFYNLATCKTQSSHSKIVEKLGDLVGEKYLVIISEDDVICRSCSTLVNTLDRLEVETQSVRRTVLHFLEKKYSLEEGELMRSSDAKVKVSGQTQHQTLKGKGSKVNKGEGPKAMLQCNKCQYTTKFNSFMTFHLKNHDKTSASCDKCGVKLQPSKVASHSCNTQEQSNLPVIVPLEGNDQQCVLQPMNCEPTNLLETLETMGNSSSGTAVASNVTSNQVIAITQDGKFRTVQVPIL